MTVLGRAYLILSLSILVLGVLWASVTLAAPENTGKWAEVVLMVPRADLVEPFQPRRFSVHTPGLMAGWAVAGVTLAALGVRAPLRIRQAAITQRRIRELEREVLELRTLPLRQEEEDEILAAEAHLDVRPQKVMTSKFAREQDAGSGIRGALP